MVNKMINNALTKEKAESLAYASPVCTAISAETQRAISSSGTENVGEVDGVW